MNTNTAWANAEREADRQHAFTLSPTGQRQHFINKSTARKQPVVKPVPPPAFKPSSSQKTQSVPPAFNFYLYASSQKSAVLVDRVYDRWMTTGHRFGRPLSSDVLQKYRSIIELVTLNLLWALLRNINSVRIRREERMYRTKSRYRPEYIDKKILTVLDNMHTMQLLNQVKGERWKKNHFLDTPAVNPKVPHAQTELFVTSVFDALVKTLYIDSLLDVAVYVDQQEIVVLKKDKSSTLMEYEETADTEKLRAQMREINRMLADAGPLVAPEIRGMKSFAALDERQRHLVRRFTHNSFQSGGRLWGGFWETGLHREQRPHVLRIRGEKTVECDFTGMMPRLAYMELGIEPPAGDVYSIPGLSPESRAGIKILLLSHFMETRTKPRDRFPEGVAALFTKEDQVKGYKAVHALIAAHHPALVPLFGIGAGHSLQFKESTLLVNILLRITLRGMVALPLHDGLIIPESTAEAVCELMEGEAYRLYKVCLPVSVKDQKDKDRPSKAV